MILPQRLPQSVNQARPWLGYDQRNAWLFLAPLFAVLGAVAVFPVLYSFWISLYDLKLTRPQRVPFVGLENYAEVLQESLFWESVGRTAYFSVISVAAIMLIALAIAVLLNEEFRGRRALSAILARAGTINAVIMGNSFDVLLIRLSSTACS